MNTMSLYELINSMPKDFSDPIDKEESFFIKDKNAILELRKARWIYIRLGEFLNYNIASASSFKTRTEIYRKKVDYSKIEQDSFVCKQMAMIYAKALNYVGLKAVTIEFPQGYDYNHMAVLFEISSGHQFMADITMDLKNIKSGMTTQNFGSGFPIKYNIVDDFGFDRDIWEINALKNGEVLSPYDIENLIDTDIIGYKKYGMYTNTFLEQFYEELKSKEKVEQYIIQNRVIPKNPTERDSYILRYKFEFLAQHISIQNLDYLSGRDFLREAICNVFPQTEQKSFYWLNLKRKSDTNESHKEFASCFVIHNESLDNNYYIYRGYEYLKPLSKNEFLKVLKQEGWELPKQDMIMEAVLEPEILAYYKRTTEEDCLE